MIFGIDELRFGYPTKGPCRESQDWSRSTKPDQNLIHDRLFDERTIIDSLKVELVGK